MTKEQLMSLTDGQLQEALFDALDDYDYWSSSDDGSDGACWDHRVRPVLDEAKRRGIELRMKR